MLLRLVRGGAPEYDQLATQLQKAFTELVTAIKSGCSAPGLGRSAGAGPWPVLRPQGRPGERRNLSELMPRPVAAWILPWTSETVLGGVVWEKYKAFLLVTCGIPLGVSALSGGGFVYLLLQGSGPWMVVGMLVTGVLAVAGLVAGLIALLFVQGMDKWQF